MPTHFNFADVFEEITAAVPGAPCQIHGEKVVTWRDFDRRANALARDLLDAGLGQQAKLAAYLYNGTEYLETYAAAFKAGLVPVNTNFRYGPDELTYLWENADAEAIVFDTALLEQVESVRGRLPGVRRWYAVGPGADELPAWATAYEACVADGAEKVMAPWGRSGDDLLLLYTGGTTGMPKGVMWRQDDIFRALGAGGHPLFGGEAVETPAELGARLSAPGPVGLPACPLMHGTGQFHSFIVMTMGGSVVSLTSRRFDPAELWSAVERRRISSVALVGDAFARPLLAELDAAPGRYDLSSVANLVSSGVMWSQEVKQGLLRHIPDAVLFDSYGSSEAVGLGASVTTKGGVEATANFELGPGATVFGDDGTPVEPGSGRVGRVAVPGTVPLGYYKDPVKTAETFIEYAGTRYSMPGDYAEVLADGRIVLLGRGSVCINTGGEKVFPEEVEEALKRHRDIADAVCVGVPDERFGQAICGVVEPARAGAKLDLSDVQAFVREHLADYKAPRRLVVVDSVGRAANGKADYKALGELARRELGL